MFETIALLAGIFSSSFIVALSGALMPGPLLTITIVETGKRGIWAGPLLIIGHAILEIVMIFILVVGFGTYLKTDLVFSLIAVLGSFILLWMAYGLLKTPPQLDVQIKPDIANHKKSKHPVITGILASLANPYWTIWWVTIGLSFITKSTSVGWMGVTAFFMGHILADFIWYFLISLGFTKGKRFLNEKIYKGIMIFCALFLTFFAFWFGYEGITKLIKIL